MRTSRGGYTGHSDTNTVSVAASCVKMGDSTSETMPQLPEMVGRDARKVPGDHTRRHWCQLTNRRYGAGSWATADQMHNRVRSPSKLILQVLSVQHGVAVR